MAFGPEARIAAGYYGNPSGVVVFDAHGERIRPAPLKVEEGSVRGVAFGPEGRIAAGYVGRRPDPSGVVVFDTPRERVRPVPLAVSEGEVWGVAFGPEGASPPVTPASVPAAAWWSSTHHETYPHHADLLEDGEHQNRRSPPCVGFCPFAVNHNVSVKSGPPERGAREVLRPFSRGVGATRREHEEHEGQHEGQAPCGTGRQAPCGLNGEGQAPCGLIAVSSAQRRLRNHKIKRENAQGRTSP